MQSRMDKYNNNSNFSSRVQKNQALYEEVKNSSIEDFNVDSNVSVIGKSSNNIDVDNLKKILDTKYSDDTPKRRSIALDYTYEKPKVEEPIQDTKEYDINVILQKAKSGKDVNYNKERLKSVRQTQYEILNNLDLNKKEEPDAYETKKKADEDNLMDLINTITALELKNKKKVDKEVSQALDLFDDLAADDDEDKPVQKVEIETPKPKKEEIKESPKVVEKETKSEPVKKEIQPEKVEEAQEDYDEHIEKTLTKLNVNVDKYDEFSDVEKGDKMALILKVMVFLIIILLIIGTVFIINNMLGLGLFD